jgi:beta-lactamase regulating signal transducer with metallopeptidase domain/thiol-disulfide isomerase/thioredoxin
MNARLESLGWWAIDFHLAGATVLCVACVALVALRQPAQRLALAWATSGGLLLLALLAALPGWPRTSWRIGVLQVDRPAEVTRIDRTDAVALARTPSPDESSLEAAPAAQSSEIDAQRGSVEGATNVAAPSPARDVARQVPPRRINVPAAIGALFATSAALSCAWLFIGTMQVARLRGRAKCAPTMLVELLDHMIGGAGRTPRLLVSGDVNQPLATGVMRPAIVIPERMLVDEPASHLSAALAHEWSHIRHGDLWLLALSRLLLPLLALEPLFWWWRRTVRQAQEELADAEAATQGDRIAYAEVLLSWARRTPERMPRGMAGSLALWERPSQLKRRVFRLLHGGLVELRSSRRLRLTVTAATLAAVAMLSLQSLRPAVSATGNDSAQSHDGITLVGHVLTEGKPAGGANVYLCESPASWSPIDGGMRPSPTRNISQSTADANGRFEFKNLAWPERRPGREHILPLDVIAVAPGRGLAWRHVAALPSQPLQLSLRDEQKVAGRVVERDGLPVAGARIRVREIADLAEPCHPNLDSAGYVDLESSDVPLATVTDANGQFVLRGLPRDVRATVLVDDERYVRREAYVATTDQRQHDLIEWRERPGGKSRVMPVNLWYCKIDVERAYRVHGRVVFADSGRPAAGASWQYPPTISPVADITGDGRFLLRGLGPGKISISVSPPPDSGYLGVASTFDLSGDEYDVEHTVELPLGEVVRGRVIDAQSGKGIGGATIWHIQQQGSLQNPRPFAKNAESAADGGFAIAVLPGTAELVVTGAVPGYITHQRSGPVSAAPPHFHRPIDVRAGQTHAEVVFELQPSPNAALAARVRDDHGKAVEHAEVQYQGYDGVGTSQRPVRTTSDAQGGFVLKDLEPSFHYDVHVHDRRHGLGAFLVLSRVDRPKAPLTIELKPLAAARGRVVNEAGRPIAGAVAWLYVKQGRYSHVDGEPVAANADGKFELTGLLPGATYSVQTSADGYATRHDEEFTAASGQNHSLGDIVLPPANLEVSGVLVDAQGKPVVGARVYAHAILRDSRLRARTKTRLTDDQGRFHLAGLPRGDAVVWQTFDQFDHRQSMLGQVPAGKTDLRFTTTAAGSPPGEDQGAGDAVPARDKTKKTTDAASKPIVEGVPAVRLLDTDGKPVAGAWVGVGAYGDSEQTPVWSPYSPKGVSGDDGRAEIVGRSLPDGRLVLYARHDGRNLAALQGSSREELLATPDIALQPACRVHGALASDGLVKAGQKLDWTNVYLHSHDDRPLSFSSKQQRFEFHLPQGNYRLSAYGTDTLTVEREIEVPADQDEVDLGTIDLGATKLATLIGQPAPELRDIKGWKNGPGVTLAELRGKYVLLDFWGHWCGPCLRGMPHLMKLHDAFADRGLVVIAVHDASVESIAEMDGKLNEKRTWGTVREREWWGRDLPFRVALDGGMPPAGVERNHWHGATTEAYGINMFPTTLLIDREGKIVKQVAAWDSNLPDELAQLLGVAGKPPTWRHRFDQVYQLAPGEVLRHVPVPFIPERTNFITERNALGGAGEWPERFTVEWDGAAVWSTPHGDATLMPLLGSLAGWHRAWGTDIFDCPVELGRQKIPGDWCVAREAPLAKRLEALERLLRDELHLPIRIERKQVERDAIVVSGQYRFVPLRPDDKYVHLSTDNHDLDDECGGGPGGFPEMVEWLSGFTGVPFVAEAAGPPDVGVELRQHPSTILRKPFPAKELDQIIANLARQTSLKFERQRRPVDVWSVSEER